MDGEIIAGLAGVVLAFVGLIVLEKALEKFFPKSTPPKRQHTKFDYAFALVMTGIVLFVGYALASCSYREVTTEIQAKAFQSEVAAQRITLGAGQTRSLYVSNNWVGSFLVNWENGQRPADLVGCVKIWVQHDLIEVNPDDPRVKALLDKYPAVGLKHAIEVDRDLCRPN